jgi:hypothetical protein
MHLFEVRCCVRWKSCLRVVRALQFLLEPGRLGNQEGCPERTTKAKDLRSRLKNGTLLLDGNRVFRKNAPKQWLHPFTNIKLVSFAIHNKRPTGLALS